MRYPIATALLLAACNLNPKSDDTDTDDTGSPPTSDDTIQEIQEGAIADEADVVLEGVVATSGITLEGDGFYVQEPGGGPWSGIYVYLYGTFDEVTIEPGDLLDIYGTVAEYYDFTEVSVTSTYDIVNQGTAEVTVDDVACGESDLEQWEGCLISVAELTVTSEINSYGEAETDCGLKLDDQLYDLTTETGARYDSVTGPLYYSFEEYKLEPRSESDLAGYTPGEGPENATIAEIHSGTYGDGDVVQLEGVVATTASSTGGSQFCIQDEGGGPDSGLTVYVGDDTWDGQAGAVLDMRGEIDEYKGLLEIKPSEITDTGATSTPQAEVMGSAPDDWETWESALVTLEDVELTAEGEYGEFTTNWGINIDDYYWSYSLTAGDSYSSVTGVIRYAFGAFTLCPRGAEDLVE